MRAPERTLRRAAALGLRRLGWTRSAPAPRAVPVGLVEEFHKTLAVGWVAVPAAAPPLQVGLYLGDTQIAAAWASTPIDRAVCPGATGEAGEAREFRFKVRGIWEFARRSTRISVRVGGQPLPVLGHGMFVRPARNGARRPADLVALLAAGHVFSQTGQVQLSRRLDVAWQLEVLGLYEGVRAALADAFGYEAFVIYGSLLGAVREGGFLGHDLDFDAAYISRHTDPAAAGAELKAVALALIERGFDVDCRRIALHIHAASDPAIRIDLFHLFFDADGVLSFPFGVAGDTDVRVEDWQGLEERPFGAGSVLVPVNGEQMAATIYGAGWREPNPGFSWARDRTRKAAGAFVPPEGVEEVRVANLAAKVTR